MLDNMNFKRVKFSSWSKIYLRIMWCLLIKAENCVTTSGLVTTVPGIEVWDEGDWWPWFWAGRGLCRESADTQRVVRASRPLFSSILCKVLGLGVERIHSPYFRGVQLEKRRLYVHIERYRGEAVISLVLIRSQN